jgi:8-oxo-dGTP pyrophosphatase MutT (NUDIX family)
LIDHIREKLSRHSPASLHAEHDDRRRAAVLVPVIEDSETRILLTERAGNLVAHGGEVAFPGGMEDETDSSLVFTALRENEEEIGIQPGEVEIVGELRPFISKYGLHVTPYVGILSADLDYSPNPDEIASVFEVPLDYFGQAEPVRVDHISRHGESHRVAVYDFEGYEIWGLTAMILAEFLNVIHGESGSFRGSHK